MAPPDRDDYPRDEGAEVLAQLKLDEGSRSRLTRNAGRLASWLEWLLHPEQHDYDRTVTYPDGTKREEEKRTTRANPTPGHYDPVDLPFESVIAHFHLDQFLDGMAAFATQEVERPNGLLAHGAAAAKNVWWVGDKHMLQLVHEFPSEEQWSGAAADKARAFIGDMATAVTQLNKIAGEFANMVPRYGLIVKTARDNLDRAAADLVAAFEKKFNERTTDISLDIKGIVIGGIVTAVTAYAAGVGGLLIAERVIEGAWTSVFTETLGTLEKSLTSRGHIAGPLWMDLAKTYMRTQADILSDAVTSLATLARDCQALIARFDSDVQPLLDKYGS